MASNSDAQNICQNAAASAANNNEEEQDRLEEVQADNEREINEEQNQNDEESAANNRTTTASYSPDSDEESSSNSFQNVTNHGRPPVSIVTGIPNRNVSPHQQREERVVPRERQPAPQRRRPGAASNPFYNWQAMKTTVRDRFQYLHNNETLADVHFVVGRGRQAQRIPAHKLILSAGSVVFDAMFNSILASPSDDIELPDVEASAFLSLLRFLYTDEVQIGPEIVMTTLYTAKKYAVPALEAHCVEFLKKNLGPHNAFMLLTQARLFDEPQLAALCLDCIDHNTSEAFNADGFTDIDFETLLMVMKRDSLDIRECKLFAAILRWAAAECSRQDLEITSASKRKVLGHSIDLIRFPLMTIEEFAQGPAQSELLTEREIVDLFLYFTLNPKPRIPYSDVVRHGVKSKEQRIISRFYEVAQR